MKKKISTKECFGSLIDNENGKRYGVKVTIIGGQLGIHIQGYGDKSSNDNIGQPVLLDMNDDKLEVIVWSDINQDDPSHIIDLTGAKLENRIEDDYHNESMKSQDDD